MRFASTAALVLPLTLSATASAQVRPWCFTGFHPGEVRGTVFLPEGDLFCPLVADPKAERSFMSLQRGRFPSLQSGVDVDDDMDIGAVGLADALPLRLSAQVELREDARHQRQLDALINADYLVGLPVTLRWSGFSSRLRLYHQSSHLGDKMLRTDVPRANLSFESLELLLSQEFGPARAYAGLHLTL